MRLCFAVQHVPLHFFQPYRKMIYIIQIRNVPPFKDLDPSSGDRSSGRRLKPSPAQGENTRNTAGAA